jgi:hypothetical protein
MTKDFSLAGQNRGLRIQHTPLDCPQPKDSSVRADNNNQIPSRAYNSIQAPLPPRNSGIKHLMAFRGNSAAQPVVGETYTVRIVPSDETWSRIEQAAGSICLDGDELEVFPNAKSESSK